MLKRRLKQDEIMSLTLAIIDKYQPSSNTVEELCAEILNAYVQSIEYFEKKNEEYSNNTPPRSLVL